MKRLVASLTLALAAFTSVGISTGVASASPAITPNCSVGAFKGSCGTQVTTSSPGLGMAASGSVTSPYAKVGSPVLGRSNLSTRATDFYTFAPANSQNNSKVFNWAPNARRSNFCVAQTSVGSPVVFRKCNSSTWQQWVAAPATDPASNSGFTWTNVATGQVLTASNQGGKLNAVDATSAPSSKQVWNFDTTTP